MQVAFKAKATRICDNKRNSAAINPLTNNNISNNRRQQRRYPEPLPEDLELIERVDDVETN